MLWCLLKPVWEQFPNEVPSYINTVCLLVSSQSEADGGVCFDISAYLTCVCKPVIFIVDKTVRRKCSQNHRPMCSVIIISVLCQWGFTWTKQKSHLIFSFSVCQDILIVWKKKTCCRISSTSTNLSVVADFFYSLIYIRK